MQIIHTCFELSNVLRAHKRVAFVPTMGNLHAGHLHLVDIAKQHADCVVVSIFVNPLQFGPNEDLANYPRTLEADYEKLAAAKVGIVFVPTVYEIYPGFDGKNLNQSMMIQLPAIADDLCGASRPGHFAGVATVVMKLFNIVQPNLAVFGKKDFQQLFIIRKMVNQFNLPIEVIPAETLRLPSGLALSSRNGYLNPTEKLQAAQLYSALNDTVAVTRLKQNDFDQIEKSASEQLTKQGWLVDYISIRSAVTLTPALKGQQKLVVLGAAKLANTRLIDNIEFELAY